MVRIDDSGDPEIQPTRWWEYEDANIAREQARQKLAQVGQTIAPMVESGDFAGARQAVQNAAKPAGDPIGGWLQKRVKDKLSERWQAQEPEPAPYTGNRIYIDETPGAKASNIAPGRQLFDPNKSYAPGSEEDKAANHPHPPSLLERAGDIASGVKDYFNRVNQRAAENQGSNFVEDLGHAMSGNQQIRILSGKEPEELPGPLPDVTDALASPANLMGMGISSTGVKAVGAELAKKWAAQTVAGVSAIEAQKATDKGLTSYADTNLPGADIAGSPVTRTVVGLGTAALAGVGGYKAAEKALESPTVARIARGAAEATGLPEMYRQGAVPGAAMVRLDDRLGALAASADPEDWQKLAEVIRSDQGKPVVLYHGSQKPGLTELLPGEQVGGTANGLFFTKDPELAGFYGPHQYVVHATDAGMLDLMPEDSFAAFAKGALGLTDESLDDAIRMHEAGQFYNMYGSRGFQDEVVRTAKNLGFKGVVFPDSTGEFGVQPSYVMFDSVPVGAGLSGGADIPPPDTAAGSAPDLAAPESAPPLSENVPPGGGDVPPPLDTSPGQGGANTPPPPPPGVSTIEPTPNEPTRVVPDLGENGIHTAIRQKTEVYKANGALTRHLPPPMMKLVGAFNPAATQAPEVTIAWRARGGTRAQLNSVWHAQMEPYVQAVEEAMTNSPARYIGPKGTKADGIIGTFKDIAENPELYDIPVQLRQALDAYDNARWQQVTAAARGEYGVDVLPFTADGKPGFVFAPNVPTAASLEEKINAAFPNAAPIGDVGNARTGLGSSSGIKERAYATGRDRMLADPTFQPVTDIRELNTLHIQAMSNNAANNVFRKGAGGLTKGEVIDELHPGLWQAKDAAWTKLTNARSRLTTAERQQAGAIREFKLTEAQKRAVERRLAPMEARVEALGTEYGPELSYLSGQVRELRMRQAALARKGLGEKVVTAGAKVDTLKDTIDSLQADVDELVKRYRTAGTGAYVYDGGTYRYYPPDKAATIKYLTSELSGPMKALADLGDEIRAFHLAGDASPVTVQGQLGFLASPVNAAKATKAWLGGLAHGESPTTALRRIAQTETQDVADYVFHTGREFGKQAADLSILAGRGGDKGLGRIPFLRSMEDNLFGTVQLTQYAQWKADRDLLLKWNPGMTRNMANAEAANFLSKLVPSLSPSERAISGARASLERATMTSVSFAASPALVLKDFSSGMAKLAYNAAGHPQTAWRALDGREQLAIRRVLTASAMTSGLATASALMSAPSRNLDPLDAVKETFDPNSRYFLALQFGNGRSIPLGGTYRSAIKALYPSRDGLMFGNLPSWLSTRANTPVRLPYDLIRNEDFRGNKLYDGNIARPENVLRTLWYGVESSVPLSAGQAMSDVRTGDLSLSNTSQGVASQFAGVNYTPVSANEKLNQIARTTAYTDSAGVQQPGTGSFFDLPPATQDRLKKQYPELWAQSVAQGSDTRRAAEKQKQDAATAQQSDDDALLSGEMTAREWEASAGARRDQLTGALQAIYGGTDYQSSSKDRQLLDSYYAAIDASKKNGKPDWTKVDAWVSALPQSQQAFLNANTGIQATPLRQLRSQLQDAYYNIPRYRGMDAEMGNRVDQAVSMVNGTGRSDVAKLKLLRDLTDKGVIDKAVADKARHVVLGITKPTEARSRWAKQHPESAIFLAQGALDPKQLAAIQKALARQN